MILDKGIATVYRKTNTAAPGGKPSWQNVAFFESWYGELHFETAPAFPTERREEIQTDARIRILQNRHINHHDRVTLRPVNGAETPYEVLRAYHGMDADSGELISDLNLKAVDP